MKCRLLLAVLAGLALVAGTARGADSPSSGLDLERRHAVNPMLATPDGQQLSPAVRRAFDRFDANRDGTLSGSEWARYARDPEGVPLDPDGDGRISPAEFQETMLRVRYPKEESCNGTLVDVYRSCRVLGAAGSWRYALERYAFQIGETGDSSVGLLGNGRCAGLLNGPGAARRLFARALELDPSCSEAYLDLAMAEAALGRDFEAILWTGLRRLKMARAIRVDARTGYWYDLHLQRILERVAGFLETRPGRQTQTAQLRRFVREELSVRFPRPGPPEPSLFRAGQLFQEGLFSQADRMVGEVERREPGNWRIAATRAAMSLARGKLDGVARLLARARTQGAPDDFLACLALGLEAARGDRVAVESWLASLLELKALAWRCEEAAWQLAYQGSFREAVRLLQVSSVTPYRSSLNDLLMGYCHAKLGNSDAALEFLPKIASLLLAEGWSLRISAELARQLGQESEAARLWEMICWREPWEGDAWAKVAEANRLRIQSAFDPFVLEAGMRLSSVTSSGWASLGFQWLRFHRDFVLTEMLPDEAWNFLAVTWDENSNWIACEAGERLESVRLFVLELSMAVQAELRDLLFPPGPGATSGPALGQTGR